MNKFQASALKLPRELRCIQTSPGNFKQPLGHYYFGVPEKEEYGLTATDTIANSIKGINFLLGEEAQRLVEEFLDSGYAKNVKKLSVGSSTEGGGYNLDYSRIISLLRGVQFPK